MCDCGNNLEKIRDVAKIFANYYMAKVAIYQNINGKYNFAKYDFAILNNYNIIETYDPNETI